MTAGAGSKAGCGQDCPPHKSSRAATTMETISVVLDAKLLKAVDVAARGQKVNRSTLIRQALQEHLRRLHMLELEERDRRGYQARPQRVEEHRPWEEAASWPEN
jgi:predicted transcriptional regulator